MLRSSLALLAFAGLLAVPAAAQTPSPIVFNVIGSVGDFARPLKVVSQPDNSDFLYVIEQNEADVHVLVFNGTTFVKQAAPFLDLTGKVSTGGERGLLSIAFDPDFANNNFFYVYYTKSGTGPGSGGNGDSLVERYTATSDTTADAGSGVVIIDSIDQPQSNHNGGDINFSPIDGKLYLSTGDGGGSNDSGTGHVAGGNAQSGVNLLGKLLRVNADGTIPGDNPFTSDGSFEDEIFHYGLRNPYRWSFDQETGDLWIGDVGQFAREEVDFLPEAVHAEGGKNFGWRCEEGFNCTGLSGCSCADPSLIEPVTDFSTGGSAAVIGGVVYRGDAIPDLDGTYFYGKHSSGQIWSLDGPSGTPTNRTAELGGGFLSILGFGNDSNGEVYLVSSTGSGRLYSLAPADPILGLGFALPGTHGDPILWGVGDLTGGSGLEVNLRNANESSVAALFVSLVNTPTAFKGGTLVTIPTLVTISIATNGNGEIFLPAVWPGGIGAGTEIFMQYGIDDDAAVKNVALSNAIRLTAQ